MVAGLALAGGVGAGHSVVVVTPESPDPCGGVMSGICPAGAGCRRRLWPHHDGLIRSMSTTGIAVPAVWLITGLPRQDFSPGLTPATTSNPTVEENIAMSSRPATVTDHYRNVVGIDTDAVTHSYYVVAASSRALVDQATFPTTTRAGLRRARDWIGRRTEGDLDSVLVAAEGTGSYGAIRTDVRDIGTAARIGHLVQQSPPWASRAPASAGAIVKTCG